MVQCVPKVLTVKGASFTGRVGSCYSPVHLIAAESRNKMTLSALSPMYRIMAVTGAEGMANRGKTSQLLTTFCFWCTCYLAGRLLFHSSTFLHSYH